MRKAMQIMMESDSGLEVVGLTRDGAEGVDMVKELKPDCITLDMEMPRMAGLEALEIIMRETPTPVLEVSSITTEGAHITLEALAKGAVDFIPKTNSFVAVDITQIRADLISKVKAMVEDRRRRKPEFIAAQERRHKRQADLNNLTLEHTTIPSQLKGRKHTVVAIGVSTGGPPVVQHILDHLPADFPVGILIAQHMPATFTKPFADRLNKTCALEVREAESGDELDNGVVLIGPGGRHLRLAQAGSRVKVLLTTEPEGKVYFPSADVLFSSVVSIFGSQSLGVILTGMGQDGLGGLMDLDEAGGTIIAQDEESSAVYGMPRAAVDAGIADMVSPAAAMPSIIQQLGRVNTI